MLSDTAPNQPITYRAFLEQQNGPIAFYLIEQHHDTTTHVSWILKVPQSLIDELGAAPLIEFRIGAFLVGTILVVAVLIRIGRTKTILESWINGYNVSQDGLQVIQILQNQSHLTLHFFDQHAVEQRALRIDNPSCHFFRNCYERILSGPRWTMEEFDQAKALLCNQHRTPAALWNALHN